MPRMQRPELDFLPAWTRARFEDVFLVGVCIFAAACSYGGAHEDAGARGPAQRPPTEIEVALPIDASMPPDLSPVSEPDWSKIKAYLDSLWSSSKSLLRAYPGATTFWTGPDNMVAMRAYQYLPTPDMARRDAIANALRAYKVCGCADAAGHDAQSNHYIDPLVTKGAKISTAPYSFCERKPCHGANESCDETVLHRDYAANGWNGDTCNFWLCNTDAATDWDATGRGRGYASILALQILNARNRGTPTEAMWTKLVGKWDGQGIYDQATVNNGYYFTYKVALLKICSRVLGKPLPMGVDEKLKEAQGPNGGIRSTYALDGTFTLDQKGDAETTSYVVLAYRKPVADF